MAVLTNLVEDKDVTCKKNCADKHFHNILRLFDALPNFSSTKSETMRNYYLETWYIRIVSQVNEGLKTFDLRKLGNVRKVPKLYR